MAGSERVDENKQAQPDNVNKMPIPCDRFKCEVMIGFEMTFHAADHDHGQHDGAERDVHAVKAGQHEKCRTIDS